MIFGVSETEISGLNILTRLNYMDERGRFSKLYSSEQLKRYGFFNGIAQVNFSQTNNIGTVRGLHYQTMPYSDTKIVACVRGAVWDVAVDIRESSPTFLQWHAEEISSSNNKMMVIPAGFAHGFQSLSNDVELVYLHSREYIPDMERTLSVSDPKLSIRWPLEISNLSARDFNCKFINGDFKGEYV